MRRVVTICLEMTNMKRIPHDGHTSPHTITVPDAVHAALKAASQATGYSEAALYSLGGELVAALLVGGDPQAIGRKLATVTTRPAATCWALLAVVDGLVGN